MFTDIAYQNQSFSLDALRVLVVDDDNDARDLLKIILEEFSAQVVTATSAMEGLKLLFQWRPDVLISDIAMPKVDGYSLIRKIRTLDFPLGAIPAIAVTAMSTKETRPLAFEFGFDACIEKPIDADMLIRVITELARRKK